MTFYVKLGKKKYPFTDYNEAFNFALDNCLDPDTAVYFVTKK